MQRQHCAKEPSDNFHRHHSTLCIKPSRARNLPVEFGKPQAHAEDIRFFTLNPMSVGRGDDGVIREALNAEAPRVMAVMDPLKLVLTGLNEGDSIELKAPYFPADVPREGTRSLWLRRELWIERDDFMVEPPAGFRRLSPGQAVRLRHGPIVRCDELVQDEAGEVVEIRCTLDTDSIGGKGTMGWKARGASMVSPPSRSPPPAPGATRSA